MNDTSKNSKTKKIPKKPDNKLDSKKTITVTIEELDQLKKRNAELEKEKLAAEEANFLKSQFLASMTHELKSPLGAIFNYTQYLRKIHPEQEDFIFKHIDLCKNQLMDTVKKLIDISQLHINKFPYQPQICNIPKILSDTILTIEILALQKGLAVTINCEEADIYSNVDPYAISHAFLNILDNAIKYTEEEKGHIDIRLTRDKSGNIIIEFICPPVEVYSHSYYICFDIFCMFNKILLCNCY
ncbi:MAG: HAMP domain-containing histidine kinase [Rickettsiales bacterium]|nr:MAG: HAMP domain-containing histidine kinase [Rickettsiales bacterium]